MVLPSFKHIALFVSSGWGGLISCTPQEPRAETPVNVTAQSSEQGKAPGPSAAATGPSIDRGGRLYDNWVAEKDLRQTFTADASKTTEFDGRGGPNGNGTLNDGAGKPLANTGHDYRLKNFFGWDLRGKAGIYGPAAQNKEYVLDVDLLSDTRSEAELFRHLKQGSTELPAFGALLDDNDLRDVVAFIIGVRTRALPQPMDVFELDAEAPKNYRLRPGADAKRGANTFGQRCSECHGADGARILIDDEETVGTLSRTSGYEIWLKILNGHPGSSMGPQILATDGSGPEQGQLILDILAALCNRAAFVAGLDKDVPDGDVRCGAYLK